MYIYIQFNNKLLNFNIPKNNLVIDLKKNINMKINFHSKKYYLYYNNKYLQDNKNLNIYNLKNGSIINLKYNINGGGTATAKTNSTSDTRNLLQSTLKNDCNTSCTVSQTTKNVNIDAPELCYNMDWTSTANCIGSCDIGVISQAVAKVKQKIKGASLAVGAGTNADVDVSGNAISEIQQEILNKCNNSKKINQSIDGLPLYIRDPTSYTKDNCMNIDFSKYADAKTQCYLKAALQTISEISQDASASSKDVKKGPNVIIVGIIVGASLIGFILIIILFLYFKISGTNDKGKAYGARFGQF